MAGERRAALDAVLDAATVITMTADEAAQITGESDARAACMQLLARPSSAATWVIVKLGVEGAVLAEAPHGRKRAHLREGDVRFVQQHAFSVPVEDTVGCGDSFAAAVRTHQRRLRACSYTSALLVALPRLIVWQDN